MTGDGASGGDQRRTVSRRRFVAAAGASGVAVALAGCPETESNGRGNGSTSTGAATGTATGTETATDASGAVRWAFEPSAVSGNADALRATFHDNGLSDDVTVEFVPGDEDMDQRRADYTRALDAGESNLDLFLVRYDWVQTFAHREQIANLSDLLSQETVSAIGEEYFDAFTATARAPESGDLFGVPFSPDFGTMQYRVDLVEEAGYDPLENDWATDPMTWEEWSNVAADTYDNADVEYGFTTQWDIYEGTACCTFNEVMSSWGGAYFGGRDNLFGPVGDRPITVDDDAVVRSLNMMRKFVHDETVGELNAYGGGFTPTDVLGWIEEDARAAFTGGDAVFHRNWGRSLARTGRNPDDTNDPALGENLGVMPMPYAVSEEDAEFQGTGGTTAGIDGWHVTVNPNSANFEAVSQVLEVLTEPDFQTDLFSLLGWLPPRPDLFESAEAAGLGQYLDTLRLAGENAMPPPVTRVWNDQASVAAQEANRAVGQEVSARAAMQQLGSTFEEIERSA